LSRNETIAFHFILSYNPLHRNLLLFTMPDLAPSRTSRASRTSTDATAQVATNAAVASDAPKRSRGRPRQDDMAARTEELIKIALTLFIERGYSNVSLEQIARTAHVAVRTIYVKFGGKAGLLAAAINSGRDRFFADMADMASDTRLLPEILQDFGRRFLELVTSNNSISMQRLVIAEVKSNPELAQIFYQTGPQRTQAQLVGFFSRPEILAQCRPGLTPLLLSTHLMACLLGDRLKQLLFNPDTLSAEADVVQQVQVGLNLFFHGVTAG
jgi:AcrR family transcriptional regulator